MLTSLIEMLKLPNFGHMTTCTISFESRDEFFSVRSWIEIMTSWSLFENILILRRPRKGLLLISSKVWSFLLKQSLKTQKMLKEL